MEARYKAGDSNAAPNFPVYTTLLQAWAKAGEPARAGEVLAAMVRKFETGHLDRQPNTRSFNTVLQAWGRSTQLDAADKAEEGLDSMHSLATSGRLNVRPDLFTYSCAISAHVRAGRPDSAERAHKLLQRLKVLHAETGDAACRPDLRVYADMVCVWTNSRSPQAANRIEELFLELSQMGGPSWREQGLIACRRMLEALSNCPLPERVQLVERLVDVMCKNDIHLDAFMAKTVDRMMSSANGRHSAQ
jgi:pentatricopeptide repeat protein